MWSQSDRRVHQGLSDQVGLLSLFKLPEAVGRFGQEWIKVFRISAAFILGFFGKSFNFLSMHESVSANRSLQSVCCNFIHPVAEPRGSTSELSVLVISMSHTGFKQRGHFQWQYMQLPRGLSSGFFAVLGEGSSSHTDSSKMLSIQTDSHACRKPHYHMSGILNLCCSRSRNPRKPCHYLILKRPSKRGS